jgi:hypothetical protein
LDEPADRAGLLLETAMAAMSLSPRNGERAARRIARASIRTGLPAARPRMPAKQKGIWRGIVDRRKSTAPSHRQPHMEFSACRLRITQKDLRVLVALGGRPDMHVHLAGNGRTGVLHGRRNSKRVDEDRSIASKNA